MQIIICDCQEEIAFAAATASLVKIKRSQTARGHAMNLGFKEEARQQMIRQLSVEKTEPRLPSVYESGLKAMSPDLQKLRQTIIQACSVNTCLPEMRDLHRTMQKLVRAFGSNAVATILFIVMDRTRGKGEWFPIIVRTPHIPEHLQHYFMLYHPGRNILSGFTLDAVVGGTTCYSRDFQLPMLKEALSDGTLKQRLEIGARRLDLALPAQELIKIFSKAFEESLARHTPEKAFFET